MLVRQQQKMAAQKGVVMEGRDIGSVVIPIVQLKFFMTADVDVRTKRRQDELLKQENYFRWKNSRRICSTATG